MTMTRAFAAALTLAALASIEVPPAAAEAAPCRPWCVYYAGRDGGGGTNCGFISYEQCKWTAQGSDICMPNGSCPPQPGARGGPPGGYDTGGQGERRRR
jgi:hypothetical protein